MVIQSWKVFMTRSQREKTNVTCWFFPNFYIFSFVTKFASANFVTLNWTINVQQRNLNIHKKLIINESCIQNQGGFIVVRKILVGRR